MPPSTLQQPMIPYLWAREMLDDVLLALTEESSAGAPGRVCVYNGAEAVTYDDCCDGQLWAVWSRTIPSDWRVQAFGRYPSSSPRTAAQASGCFQLIAMDFEIGLVRCAPTLQDNGEPPTEAEIEESAMLQHEDAWIILRTVLCTLAEWDQGGVFTAWEQQQPLDDDGGCVGSVMRFSVGHSICPCQDLVVGS